MSHRGIDITTARSSDMVSTYYHYHTISSDTNVLLWDRTPQDCTEGKACIHLIYILYT